MSDYVRKKLDPDELYSQALRFAGWSMLVLGSLNLILNVLAVALGKVTSLEIVLGMVMSVACGIGFVIGGFYILRRQ